MRTVSVFVTLFALITPLVSANLRGHRETQEIFGDLVQKVLESMTNLNGGIPMDEILQRIYDQSNNVLG